MYDIAHQEAIFDNKGHALSYHVTGSYIWEMVPPMLHELDGQQNHIDNLVQIYGISSALPVKIP